MEKFAVDLDKVLDEFEFNEDRAEQMATVVAKRTNATIPPVVGGTLLHQPASSCYRRPAFEPINLADADFAADPQTSMPRYNASFSSSAINSSARPPSDDGSRYSSRSENVNRGNEPRIRNDTGMNIEWSQNLSSSAFRNHNRIDVNVAEQKRRLSSQNKNYSDEICIHRNVVHHPRNTDLRWQQDTLHDRSETSTNKLNVSGVFSSLNEYLSTGNIEAKLGDVNAVSNQTSWNAARHRPAEAEENDNYAVNQPETPAANTKGSYDRGSSLLYPSINADTRAEGQILGRQSTSDDFLENIRNDELRLASDRWETTIDVCKISENSTRSSFADLIPVAYSRSVQEDVDTSGKSAGGDRASTDETPDLLDTTSGSNKSVNLGRASLPNPRIKDDAHFSVGEDDGSTAQFAGVISRGPSLGSFVSKDNQPNLTLLPDVATSGRNVLKTSSIVASVTSDLVTSHGARVFDDEASEEQPNCNGSELDLVSHRTEINETKAVSPLLDSSEAISVEGSKVHEVFRPPDSSDNRVEGAQSTHVNQELNFPENVTSRYGDAYFSASVESESNARSKISSCEENGNADDTSRQIVPVGFNFVDTLSDTELHQYLQELEDNDQDSESDQDDVVESTVKTGIGLSSEREDVLVETSGVNADEGKSLVGDYKAENKAEGKDFEFSGSGAEDFGEENTVNVGQDSLDGSEAEPATDCSLPVKEASRYIAHGEGSTSSREPNSADYSLHYKSARHANEDLSIVPDKFSENEAEIPVVPGFTRVTKPKMINLQSVVSSSVNAGQLQSTTMPTAVSNVPQSKETVVSESTIPQDVSTMPNVSTVTSKTSSVITNLVSIDCQQISKNVDSKPCETVSSGLDGKKKIEDDISETETAGLVATEINSPKSRESFLDSGKMESGMSPLNKLSSSSQVTNFNSVENDSTTLEIVSSSIEKTSDESLAVLENETARLSILRVTPEKDTLREHLDSASDGLRGMVMGVSEVGYSEVQSCLVRMPRDGSTINVLGEEERPSRPKYLFLPSKITVENEQEDSENSEESPPISGAVGPPGETPSAEVQTNCSEVAENIPLSSPDISESSSIEQTVSPIPSLQIATPLSDDMSDILSPEERSLGKLPPFWVPDAVAPNCMQCDIKFTVLKRRHHCRACGKVLCSKCCSLKSRLEYMDNSEARVCQPCYTTLAKVFLVEQGESASGSPSSLNEGVANVNHAPLGRQPNPNNPMEYCSTIPPLEQAASVLRQPPPSVLVPVGVLKREGSSRSRSDVAKQVIFSDGIRPGGDLTELDGSSEPRLPYRRPGRVLKRVGTPPGPPSASNHSGQRLLPPLDPKTLSYIPADRGLPPLAIINKGEVKFEDVVDHDKEMVSLKSETEPPTVFAINRNLLVQVKILNLDCCVNRTCWCFSTCGMSCVGQDEIVIILECLPDETTVPKDIFKHLNTLYQDASRGNTVSELGHTVFQGVPFLDSSDHGGFIYIRPSFQCLQKLILPSAPYLVAILVHRWETPWATVFPIRLMLRLGAEYRYYPCMLVSIRNRRPVYWEIGHTIINLLADFRNLSYTLPSVRGLVIHMEDRQTSILLPKNRYDQVTRALNNSNDHVLALASNFSFSADSHLVCIQSNRDESYHTQAINIHNKPRKVTGASFVVFNGALKTSSNLTAKSSIVEDGLMVQITPDTMQALRRALRNMQDFCVGCGPAGASQPDELVNMKWVQDDKNFNVGVKSSIDGRALDGIPSIRVHNGTDYMGSCRFIRWTEVFILQSDEGSGRSGDPLDISRLSESLARATCLALIKLLDLLAQAGLTKLAVRATVHPENVGYEAGSKGEKLPPIYMDSLDNELVPVLHKAASMSQDSSAAILELIFHVMLQ